MYRIAKAVIAFLAILILWGTEESIGGRMCIEGGDCDDGWGVSVYSRKGEYYRYEAGRFRNEKLHGQGISFKPKGAHEAGRFEIGNFKRGELDGLGIIGKENGRREEGRFKDGELHGQGLRIGLKGSREDGYFRKGELHGEGERIDKNGTKEEGQFKNGELHGEGQRTKRDGSREMGTFENGELHGYGVRTGKDGSIYKGMWEKGRQHGEGILMTVDERIICSGEWKDGKKIHCNKPKWWAVIVEEIIEDFFPAGIQEIVYGAILTGIVGLAGLLVSVIRRSQKKHL